MKKFHCLDCHNVFFSSKVEMNPSSIIRKCPYCKSTSITEQTKLNTFFHKP